MSTQLTNTLNTSGAQLQDDAVTDSPPAGYHKLISKSDGLYQRNASGTDVKLAGASISLPLSLEDGGTGEDFSAITQGALFVGGTGGGDLDTLAAGADGQVLRLASGTPAWQDEQDLSAYALLAGRSGGQILIGGTDASDNLTLQSTSNATKGNVIVNDALLTPTDAAVVPAVVRGAAGQTANLIEVQQVDSTPVLRFSADASNNTALYGFQDAGLEWIPASNAVQVKAATVFVGAGGANPRLQVLTSGITLVGENQTVAINTNQDLSIDTARLGFFGATAVVQPTGYTTFANLTTDRTLDADSTTVEEVADVLGTLIEDLKAFGLLSV